MGKQDSVSICPDERFLRRLKRKPDSFSSLQLRKTLLGGRRPRANKIEDNDYADEEKEEDMDPQYNKFLNKLRVDGNSYALELSQRNGVPVYLKYNMEGESDDEDTRPPARRKMSNSKELEKMHERKETKNKVGRPRKSRSLLGKERRDLVDDEDTKPPTGQMSYRKKGEKIHLSKVSNNKVGTPSNSRKLQGKERRDIGDDGNCKPPIMGKMKNRKKNENIQARKENKTVAGNPRILRSLQWNESRDRVEHDTDDLGLDEAYQVFLNGISKQGNFWVFECSSGRQVVYEGDEVTGLSDSEIQVWDVAPCGSGGNPTPFVSEQGYRASILGVRGHSFGEKRNSEFRKKVMDILRRPYNQDEYEKLLRDVEEEKSVGHIKDLRSRPISFAVGGATKSYLDHHADVGREIYAVKHDRPQVLNILRGFFFWLEHIADEEEEVFKPWLDASCRVVLPASR